MGKVFWRETPLTDEEEALLQALMLAHHRAVYRDNVSSVTVRNLVAGSHNYVQAIAGALLSLGGKHAPLELTREAIQNTASAVLSAQMGLRVPGWGNSFIRGEPDRVWTDVDTRLRALVPDLMGDIDYVTEHLHKLGKKVYPNPSCYTAASAIALGVPVGVTAYLFIQGRLAGWTELAMLTFKEH